jgi:RNA polymerase sigma-70 factor, ECF subfamily
MSPPIGAQSAAPSAGAEPFPLDVRTADRVVGRYWERAYRFAAMVTRNDQDSVDVAQEALLLVTRRLHQFDPERGTFDAWLWRIVVNVARDAGRASLRRRSLMERLRLDRWTGGEPDADPEALALRRLSDGGVLAAVRRLRPRPRTIIALRFGAQLTYPEIGTLLGISEAAAIMTTRRALAVLRQSLEER